MAKFITTSAYLLVTVIVDLFVRLLGRGELTLTSRILDISVLVALIAYVAQHSADYIETLITNFGRPFRDRLRSMHFFALHSPELPFLMAKPGRRT